MFKISFVVDLSGRADEDVGLRPLTCWDSGFKSHREHICLSLVSVVRSQIEVSAMAYPSSRGVLPSVGLCVCVSLIVIKGYNSLYTPTVIRKKERRKERTNERNKFFVCY